MSKLTNKLRADVAMERYHDELVEQAQGFASSSRAHKGRHIILTALGTALGVIDALEAEHEAAKKLLDGFAGFLDINEEATAARTAALGDKS